MRADLRVAQAIELRQQKRAFDRGGQAVEQLVQLHQGLQDDCAFFFTRRDCFGEIGQGLQVGALQVLATVVIKQHALGDGGQKRARLGQGRGFARREQAHERVLSQVSGALRAAKLAPQPACEPAVVVHIQDLNVI